MLIFEGSDCLGKSTAAKKAVRMVVEHDVAPVIYGHMTRPNGSFDFFQNYKPFISPYVIQDRFHLGSMAYHDGVMTEHHLRIVEGLIHAAGGVVVNIYCSNYHIYEQRIAADTRGNILSVQLMTEANQRFHVMALGRGHLRPIIDFNIDVGDGYVSDETIEAIVQTWMERRKEAMKLWTL